MSAKVDICNIMGVKIAAINMSQLMRLTKDNLKKWSGKYICVANVHSTVTASRDAEYMYIQNHSVLTIPDGGPLSSVGRHRGYKDMRRTTGPDYLDQVLRISAENSYKHVFYGSSPETIERMKSNILSKYPDVQIKDIISPPFRELSDLEDQNMVDRINAASPDFVWVGLGAPKQEIWMLKHQDRIRGLMIGVGAAFDYEAGNISRAPRWMQKVNLEWLYRLMQDPKRLFKRYLGTNIRFIVDAVFLGK